MPHSYSTDNAAKIVADYVALPSNTQESVEGLYASLTGFRLNDALHEIKSRDPATGPGIRYFICDVTEMNRGFDYTSHFLMTCQADQDASEMYNKIYYNYRGHGIDESQGTVEFGDGLRAISGNLDEISFTEYSLFRRFLNKIGNHTNDHAGI